MGSRESLHDKLVAICPNAYFQPPSNVGLVYPCIVYRKSGINALHADNSVYVVDVGYQLTVIDRDPDTTLPETVLQSFQMCGVDTTYTVSNLHHTVLSLYY